MFDVPNLDDLSSEPGDLFQAAAVLEQLACYATTKAQAMTWRAAGDVAAALPLERACERIYRQLPEWARW